MVKEDTCVKDAIPNTLEDKLLEIVKSFKVVTFSKGKTEIGAPLI